MNTTLYENFHNVIDKSSTLQEFRTNIAEIPTVQYEIIDGIMTCIEKISTDKGQIVVLIRYLMMIVETIKGEKMGTIKKSEALVLFNKILGYLEVSQRDKKFYASIFENTVEMAFWGKQWLDDSGYKFSWNRFLCCTK